LERVNESRDPTDPEGDLMSAWGIAEWYGKDVIAMSAEERKGAADTALAIHDRFIKLTEQPECPFLGTIRPGAKCNKPGGVCSIRRYYQDEDEVFATGAQPTTMCPNRFLEHRGDISLFAYIAQKFFAVDSGAKVIKEIPFLLKETLDNEERSAKAGRIDWIVVPNPRQGESAGELQWIAVETQGVYFSGDEIWPDMVSYRNDPSRLQMPAGKRRPDYRSSGAKRLAPQLDAKSPVMSRWGRKVVVVVDIAFFEEMGSLVEASDFDNSEVVWLIMKYDAEMQLIVDSIKYAELIPSVAALQAAKPVNRAQFEDMLRSEMQKRTSKKVFDA
jgi:hypothetical protein